MNSANDTPDVLFEQRKGNSGDLGIITLNRPASLNALTYEMCVLIDQQLHFWETDPLIKAVIIQSALPDVFCAGGDVRHLYHQGQEKKYTEITQFFDVEYRLNHHIAHYKKPYIAIMNGLTMGGGLGLSVHGQFRVVTESLKMAMPETQIGFFPDIGGTYFLSRCPYEIGTYLALTGAVINAAEALFIHLADVIVPAHDVECMIKALQDSAFTDQDTDIIQACLQRYHLTVEQPVFFSRRHIIEACFSKNTIETIIAMLTSYELEWCDAILAELHHKSPLSLKVTLEALRRGVSMDINSCQRMEANLCEHFIRSHDFYEGIRAALIDKDKKPQWAPATLDQVSVDEVNAFFLSFVEGDVA